MLLYLLQEVGRCGKKSRCNSLKTCFVISNLHFGAKFLSFEHLS